MRSDKNLIPHIRSNGYQTVSLVSESGVKKTIHVHRFVAHQLVEGEEDGLVVNHKDGDPSNNSIENLEWVTQKYNIYHATHIIKTRDYTGDKHPMYGKTHTKEAREKISEARSKITGSKHWRSQPLVAVDYKTGEYYKTYESQCLAAKDIGASQGNIHGVLNGSRKYAKGYTFYHLEDWENKHNTK